MGFRSPGHQLSKLSRLWNVLAILLHGEGHKAGTRQDRNYPATLTPIGSLSYGWKHNWKGPPSSHALSRLGISNTDQRHRASAWLSQHRLLTGKEYYMTIFIGFVEWIFHQTDIFSLSFLKRSYAGTDATTGAFPPPLQEVPQISYWSHYSC